MAGSAGAAPRYFPTESLPATPRWSVLAPWSKELMAAARTVEHPYNPGLMQEAWAARTRQVLAGAAERH
jgi:DNA polymerase-3 subunit delta'